MTSYQEKENAAYSGYGAGQVSYISSGTPQYNGAPPAYYNAHPQLQYINNLNNFNQERDKQLRHAYPTLIVCLHSVFLLLISLVFIVLQIVLITYSDFIGYFGGGLWAGGFLLFTEIFTLSSLGCRNKCSIIASATLHLVSLIFTLTGCIVTNSIAISVGPCIITGYCNRELMTSIYVAFIVLGVWAMGQSIAFSAFVISRVAGATRITLQAPGQENFIVPSYSANTQQISYNQSTI